MQTKHWALVLGAVALLLAAICAWQFFAAASAPFAEILVDGSLVETVDLSVDRRFTVEGVGGYNVVEVSHGRIAVVEADCKGNDCVHTGPRSGGTPIICLPHRVVIRFSESGGIDGKVG